MLSFFLNVKNILPIFYTSLSDFNSDFDLDYDMNYDPFDDFAIISSSVFSYLYLFFKFYRLLCFSKIAFDTLPMINPYIWPFSIFRAVTQPYFSIWQKILPGIKWGRTSFDVSQILGLEALTVFMYLCGYGHRLILN